MFCTRTFVSNSPPDLAKLALCCVYGPMSADTGVHLLYDLNENRFLNGLLSDLIANDIRLTFQPSRDTAVQLLKKLGADAGQIQRSKLRFGYDGALNVFSAAPG